MRVVQKFWRLVRKDLVLEWREKRLVIASISFGLLALFVIGIALDAAPTIPIDWAAGLLWLTIWFTASMSFSRLDWKEREFGAHKALKLVPTDMSLTFYARWVSTFIFVFIPVLVLTMAIFILFNLPAPSHWVSFVMVLGLGVLSLTGIGTFLSAIVAHSTMRDIIMPLLLFPLTVPLFFAVIQWTAASLDAHAGHTGWPVVWVEVLSGYFCLTLVLPWLLYDTLTEV